MRKKYLFLMVMTILSTMLLTTSCLATALLLDSATADSPEKAQTRFNEICEEVEDASTLEEISDAVDKASEYNSESAYFDYSGIISRVNSRLQDLELPYQFENGSLVFTITPLLQECSTLSDLKHLVAIASENSQGQIPEVAAEEINSYMEKEDIPYVFELGAQDFRVSDELQDFMEEVKQQAIRKADGSVLLNWIEEYTAILTDVDAVADCMSSAADEIIKEGISRRDITQSLIETCRDYEPLFEKYLGMDADDIQNHIISRSIFFEEEKCYNDAINEGNPYLYIEEYPEGQFDASLIPINDELRAAMDAKSSVEAAEAFLEEYPKSRYAEEIESFISEEKTRIALELLKEWQESPEFDTLTEQLGPENMQKEIYVGQNGFPFAPSEMTLGELISGIDWRPYNISVEKSRLTGETTITRPFRNDEISISFRFEKDKAVITTASFNTIYIYSTTDYQDIALVFACIILPEEELDFMVELILVAYTL